MLGTLVEASIRARYFMLVLLVALLGGGAFAALRLPIDAVPDTSTIQVSVLTEASGMSSLEVERAVTFPMENALNGVPGMVELRSVSRTGISAVTVVFKDSMDPWFARQLVLERIRGVSDELPPGTGTPELAPLSTGLGEIYQFVVSSDQHSPMQLRTLLDWEIVPKLRNIPGIVEVNTMGGRLKEFHVVADPRRLQNHKLSIADLETALRGANVNVGGGYVERGAEALTLRGVGLLRSQEEIGKVVVALDEHNAPILVEHVATVDVGYALPKGVVTRDGESEAVIGVVMMLLGSNSRDVIRAVKTRVEEIQAELPPGVTIEAFYDRSDFVERTVSTVMTNLVEGAVVVFVVLALMLGSIRGAIVVVLGIPASMAIATFALCGFKNLDLQRMCDTADRIQYIRQRKLMRKVFSKIGEFYRAAMCKLTARNRRLRKVRDIGTSAGLAASCSLCAVPTPPVGANPSCAFLRRACERTGPWRVGLSPS